MNTIKATESVIIKQLCIYQIPRIPKEVLNIIMEFLFYDKVNGAAKILHKSYITRINRYIGRAKNIHYRLLCGDYDICNTRVKYCSRYVFKMRYSDISESQIYIRIIFCDLCGNYYDQDTELYSQIIKCHCYNN